MKMIYGLTMALILFITACSQQDQPNLPDNPAPPAAVQPPTEEGVIRVFEQNAAAGQPVKVKLYVNLAPGQTYYLFDEAVPEGFQIQGESDGKNHIKQVVIQDAKSTVYEYTVTASAAGTFTFSGEYAVEGNEIAAIKGSTQLVVK